MGKDEDCKFLKLQTHILGVSIDCDGCQQRVRKLLQKTEGVFSVIVDVDHQKVTVSGNVDSETLVKKLNKAGKHAELWSQKAGSQNKNNQQKQQKQPVPILKDSNNKSKDQGKNDFMQGFNAFGNQQHYKVSNDEGFSDDEEDDDIDFADLSELPLLNDNFKQFDFMKLAKNANNGKKNGNADTAAKHAKTKKKNDGGKKNEGSAKHNQTKTPNVHNNKVANNAHFANAKPNVSEGKKTNGLNGFMNLGMFGLGGGNGHAGYPSNSFNGNTALKFNGGQPMMANSQGYQTRSSATMNNMRGLNSMTPDNMFMHQPQMMYNRSPQISPYTGYYKSYPSTYNLENQSSSGNFVTHLFSDDNATGCAIM